VTRKSTRTRRAKRSSTKPGSTRAAKPAAATGKRRRGRPTREETAQRNEEYAQFGADRLIHRYGNRRYYDFRNRHTVTLQEIAEMVKKGENVRVIDVEADNEDITRRVLTQIILEEGADGTLASLPIEFLRRLIAASTSHSAVEWLDSYLKAGAQMLERTLDGSVSKSWGMGFPERLAQFMNEAANHVNYADVVKQRDRDREIAELRRRVEELARDK
jgi:polyhydroxyalkanoate synthesis repressor PhaR